MIKVFLHSPCEHARPLSLVALLTLLTLGCSAPPEKAVAGTWHRDIGCPYGASTDSFTITTKEPGTYSIVMYEPAVTGYPPRREIGGIFRRQGDQVRISMVEPGYEPNEMEFLPEAVKLILDECYYSRH